MTEDKCGSDTAVGKAAQLNQARLQGEKLMLGISAVCMYVVRAKH